VPDGDDPLSALTEMVEKLLFMFGTDTNRATVEAEDALGNRDQTVADGKSGQSFDHEGSPMTETHPKVRPSRLEDVQSL